MPRGKPRVESSGKTPNHRTSKRTASGDDLPSSTSHPAIHSEDSPSKRIKLTHPPAQPSSCSVYNMYNFSRPNHVDLTNGNGPATMTKVQKPSLRMANPAGLAAEPGPKKLVVKNFRKTPRSDPEKYINEVSSQLDAALSAILADEKLPHSNEELYRGAENLCRQGRAPQLYKSLREKCQQGIEMYIAKPLLAKASTLDDVELLGAVMEAWATWNIRLVRTRRCSRRSIMLSQTENHPLDILLPRPILSSQIAFIAVDRDDVHD